MSVHVTWDRGIVLVEHGLWLDPHVIRDVAFVSHAHSDHTRRHHLALMTPETHELLPPERRSRDVRLVGRGETTDLGAARLEVHDAGHMLGSAMLQLTHAGADLLYTGDLKLHRLGLPNTPIPTADVLIVESTYGLPHFRFPDPESAVEQVARWCRTALTSNVTPVLLANALGKSQELMLGLAPYGFTFALEERCIPWAEGYERAGITLPDWVALDGDATAAGRVVIALPAGKDEVRRLFRYRTALVSGWAQDATFRQVFGADTAFAYSDHCDFDELLEVVRLSGAERIYTVHGFAAELAKNLRGRGHRASPLRSTEQLALAL